ncbi:MAG: glycosyltransferase [Oxalobacter sp.]
MNQPKVSVIVPIYNVEEYLHECLDSVINQTLTDIEIICVNDGSTDGSPEILKEYAERDARIKVIDKPNGGYGSAMNVGLKHVMGKYIGIVEPDDYISPDMYQRLYEEAEKHQADVTKSNYTNFFDLQNGENAPEPYVNDWFTGKRKSPESIFTIREYPDFLSFHPSIWSCIYRTSFIQKHRIDFQEIKGAGWADNLFQVKTMVLSEKIAYIDEAFYCYRRRNIDDAKDLKDFTIPFKRTEEIRQWLNERNISDKGICANLTKRELNYIQLALRSITDSQLPEIVPYIERYQKQADMTALVESDDCLSSQRKMMAALQEDVRFYCMKYRKKQQPSFWKSISSVRKKLISIHFGKGRREMVFCGMRLL